MVVLTGNALPLLNDQDQASSLSFFLTFQVKFIPLILKFSTINILPIILALILPAVRLYAIDEAEFIITPYMATAWLFASLILYTLWYFLWQLWEIKKVKKMTYAGALLGTILFLIFLFFQLFEPILKEGIINISTIKIAPPIILFLTVQYVLRSQQKASRLFLEKEQLQTENYKAQLQVLQAQIDPHFLFNSLNTLRSMVRHAHSNSEEFILSLSDFYRKTLTHKENTQLPLSEELRVLESYLFLMKSRNEEAVRVDIEIDESLYSSFLPTLALQIVVENCFKHNSMTASMPLHIQISSTDEGYIDVKNNLQPKFGEVESTGYGLDLLKKRYELMNISHGMLVEQSPSHFSVKLKLIH